MMEKCVLVPRSASAYFLAKPPGRQHNLRTDLILKAEGHMSKTPGQGTRPTSGCRSRASTRRCL